MLDTLLIDDEPKARENLRIMLEKNCPEVVIRGEYGNIETAYSAIETINPDLVFLDIELGNATGFDLLGRFAQINFAIIFVTAFDQYAIRAIKSSALDYLLKPVSSKELVLAVNKAKTNVQQPNTRVQNLMEAIQSPKQKHNRIAVPHQNGFQMVAVENILFCAADKQYTYLHLADGNTICSSLNMGEYEELLALHDFFRTHHSYLVNRQHILRYIRGEGGEVIMDNHTSIPVSRRKKQEFLVWLTEK